MLFLGISAIAFAPAGPEIASEARGLMIERWIAIYRMTEDGVQIVRIADTARELNDLEWPQDELDV